MSESSVFKRGAICSLDVIDASIGHTVDVLSPFVYVLCQSDRLFHGESGLCLDVVHPGHAWSSLRVCSWLCSFHYLFLQAALFVSSWCDHV